MSTPGIDLPKQSIEAVLDPVFNAAIDSGRVPGIAGIALDAKGQVLFRKGYGVTDVVRPDAQKVTAETPNYVFSCTKLFTTVAALQLIEKKQLKLDDFVENYVPEFAKLQVLEGFDEQGKPILRPPITKAKVIHLLTHTSGLTYDFFDKATLRYRVGTGKPPANYAVEPDLEYFCTPLMFEPGTAYNYGVSTDFLGLVIEAVSGLKLDAYVSENISHPLGLEKTGYGLEGADFFQPHFKDEEGNLTSRPLRANTARGIVPGGQYLTSTAQDFAQFLLTMLNHGTHPISKVSILKPETVKQYIFQDQLASINVSNQGVGEVVTSVPAFSSQGTMLPGVKKGWSLGLMTNSEDLPHGRKAGSGGWAGLGNCYYWLDPASGKLGFVATTCFPWFDKDFLHLFDALERAVYGHAPASVPGESGSNFSGGVWQKD